MYQNNEDKKVTINIVDKIALDQTLFYPEKIFVVTSLPDNVEVGSFVLLNKDSKWLLFYYGRNIGFLDYEDLQESYEETLSMLNLDLYKYYKSIKDELGKDKHKNLLIMPIYKNLYSALKNIDAVNVTEDNISDIKKSLFKDVFSDYFIFKGNLGIDTRIGFFNIGATLCSTAFSPCVAVVARLKENKHALYHASSVSIPKGFADDIQENDIDEIFIFKKITENNHSIDIGFHFKAEPLHLEFLKLYPNVKITLVEVPLNYKTILVHNDQIILSKEFLEIVESGIKDIDEFLTSSKIQDIDDYRNECGFKKTKRYDSTVIVPRNERYIKKNDTPKDDIYSKKENIPRRNSIKIDINNIYSNIENKAKKLIKKMPKF